MPPVCVYTFLFFWRGFFALHVTVVFIRASAATFFNLARTCSFGATFFNFARLFFNLARTCSFGATFFNLARIFFTWRDFFFNLARPCSFGGTFFKFGTTFLYSLIYTSKFSLRSPHVKGNLLIVHTSKFSLTSFSFTGFPW